MINVGRKTVVLREELLKVGQTNLSPQFINLFVSGRVVKSGGVVLPQSANLRPNKMEHSATLGSPRLLEWEFRDPSLSL